MTDASHQTSLSSAVTVKLKKAQHAFSLAARSRTHSARPGSAPNPNPVPASYRARRVRSWLKSRRYSAARWTSVSGAADMSHTTGGWLWLMSGCLLTIRAYLLGTVRGSSTSLETNGKVWSQVQGQGSMPHENWAGSPRVGREHRHSPLL